MFYDQVAQNRQKLQNAFEHKAIEVKVSNKSDVDLLDEIGYKKVSDKKNVTAFGQYSFSEDTMTMSIILLPARYPLNALVVGKRGEVGFVIVHGLSGRIGANYWTVGNWIRQEAIKNLGWDPQAVFALDNGLDPSLIQYENGKKPVFLVKGRENVNASLSIVQNSLISNNRIILPIPF